MWDKNEKNSSQTITLATDTIGEIEDLTYWEV